MARKERINVRRSHDFRLIDEDLSSAMSALEETNTRVAGLLDEYQPSEDPGSEAAPEGAEAPAEGTPAEAP